MNVPATPAPTVVSARTLSTSSDVSVLLDMWEISARQTLMNAEVAPALMEQHVLTTSTPTLVHVYQASPVPAVKKISMSVSVVHVRMEVSVSTR